MRTEWWKRNHAVSNKNLQNIKGNQKSLSFWCIIWDHQSSAHFITNNIKQHQGFKHRVGQAINLFKIQLSTLGELWVAFSRHGWPQYTAGTRRVVCSQPGWVSLEPLRSAADVASHIEKPLMNSTGEPSAGRETMGSKKWNISWLMRVVHRLASTHAHAAEASQTNDRSSVWYGSSLTSFWAI